VTQNLVARASARTVPLTPLTRDKLGPWLRRQDAATRHWVRQSGFSAKPASVLLLPGGKGDGVAGALVGVEGADDIWSWGGAAAALPAGRYRIEPEPGAKAASRAALGWALGAYSFTRYKKSETNGADLVWPAKADRKAAEGAASAVALVRDLVNTPSSDMGPAELAAAGRKLAREFGARCTVTVGDALLAKNYPMIHAVGRASTRAPRLIDLRWGRRGPRVTVVGKGVCFDSGGLDLKAAGPMKMMKKDMGGAAHALGLARMVMTAKLPVRLRVLVPAVENSVSGNAFRPMDVLASRGGKTVEIGNTDAEGRLILADALAEAVREDPALVLDFATLTGAARIAVGPELAAMFANDDGLAADFQMAGAAEADPVWRMPLWKPYRRLLDSKIADINNVADTPHGGSITAALFLQEFVGERTPWAHFDVYAWNPSSRPGRPEGGEAMGIRAAFHVIRKRFG
jgi:leucyl aminopeptidase